MLKLFWAPGPASVPAEQSVNDTLRADDDATGASQTIARAGSALAKLEGALAGRLDAWLLGRAAPDGPVFVLVHGFSYDPRDAAGQPASPFSTIYGVAGPDCADIRLSLLPLVGECDPAGQPVADVAICFAWQSQGSLDDDAAAGWDNDYKYAALDLSPAAAKSLAAVLANLADRGATVRLLAHSLGTRTASQAIGLLKAAGVTPPLERAVLLGGAEFCADAAANFAGCGFDVVNIGSRRDDVLVLGEDACHPVRPNNTYPSFVLGRTGIGGNPRWLDWQFDSPMVAAWLSEAKAPTGAAYRITAVATDDVHAQGWLGHWVYYTDDGNRILLRDLMTDARMTVAALRAAGAPDGFDVPMWGQFAGHPAPPTPDTRAGRAARLAENTAHRTASV